MTQNFKNDVAQDQAKNANECFDDVEELEGNKQRENLEDISEVQQKPPKKKRLSFINVLICVVVLVLIVMFTIPMFPSYGTTTRTRVAEGLVLASSAKNLVVDNAVNGFPLSQGWTSPSSTVNTKSITIDEKTGVITITGTSKAGGIVLTLTPTDGEGKPLVVGVVPQGRVSWRCKALDSNVNWNKLPAECR